MDRFSKLVRPLFNEFVDGNKDLKEFFDKKLDENDGIMIQSMFEDFAEHYHQKQVAPIVKFSDLVYESSLPEKMTQEEYDKWYKSSVVVDGVRMGKPHKQKKWVICTADHKQFLTNLKLTPNLETVIDYSWSTQVINRIYFSKRRDAEEIKAKIGDDNFIVIEV